MQKLTLYTSPRACSSACHIALRESGLEFDIALTRIRRGEHHSGAYRQMNPWGKIPALVIGGEVLTETHAILSFIADAAAPARSLLPAPPLARARAHEWMNFLSSAVHIAFRPLFRPHYLVADERLYPELREVGVPTLKTTLLEVERRLSGRPWALGDDYSVVDPYLLVFWIWSQRADVSPLVADMPGWRAHAERMFARPASWAALRAEGITPENISDP